MSRTGAQEPQQQQKSEEEQPSPALTTCTLPTTASSGPSARQTSPSGDSARSSTLTPSTPSTSTSKVDPTVLPKRPVNQQRRKSRPNSLHRLPSSQWRQPFAESKTLESERQYLMQTLKKQGEYIERLLLRLCLAEERLAEAKQQRSTESSSFYPPSTPANGTPRRQSPREIGKEIASLKSKIAHSEEQERSSLPRLSELYIEIQKRARWDRVQRHLASTIDFQAQYYYYQQQVQSPGLHPPAPPPSAVHETFSHVTRPVEQFARMPDVQESPMEGVFSPGLASCLSPLSPDFVPGGYGNLGDPFAESFRTMGAANKATQKLVEEDKAQGNEQKEREHRPLIPTNSSVRSSSVPESAVELPFRPRRASVPTKFSWSDEDFDEYESD